jgi:PhnB protein
MSSLLNPYLQFNGNAREAMEFYQGVFGGQLTSNTFGEFGAPDPAIADLIMHASLTTDSGYALMASDIAPGMEYQPGSTVTISLSGDDTVLRDYFAKLADGGEVTLKLEKQMWGDEFGQCTDRFGIRWMVNISAAQG